MKIKHLLNLLLSLPLIMTACEQVEEPTLEPSVTVTAGTADKTTLSFIVEPKNADSAAWVVFASSEAEPSAEDILKSGTAINAKNITNATATNLANDTEYSIVAAVAGSGKLVKSEVVKMTTLKGDDPTPTPEEPSLELTTEDKLSFSAEGGNGNIGYELKNPVEGIELEAESNVAWINGIEVAESITFKVAANTSEEARDGEIIVSYGDLSFAVSVEQEGKKNENNEPIKEFNITFTSASYIQPSSYGDAEIYQFRNEDGFQANIYFEISNATPLVPGTYSYVDLVADGQFNFSGADSRISIIDENGEKQTGIYINGGNITVAIVNGEYNVDFDLNINYNSSTPFKATFKGVFANDTVWEEGQTPDDNFEYAAWDSASLVSNSGGAIEVKFGDSTNNVELYMTFYTNESYLPAATYKPGMPAEGFFAPTSYILVDGERYEYNLEGPNTLENGVEVALADDNTYTFNFKDMTFGTNRLVKGTWSGKIDGLAKEEQGGNDDFTPDYTVNQWMWKGYSGISWGNCYTVMGNRVTMEVHFCQDAATENALATGNYVWSTTTGISNEYPDRFALRSVKVDGASVTMNGGSMTVSVSGEVYTINMTLTSNNGNTYKIQFVGKLNDDFQGGGDSGDEGGVINLTSLKYKEYNSTVWAETFVLSDDAGTSFDILFNEYQANSSKIYTGEYDWITISQVGYDYGYFATNNVVIKGTSKKCSGGYVNISYTNNTYNISIDLEFNDGTKQNLKYEGPLN